MNRLTRFAVINLAVNVVVVLWGAFVRASGSGAGCGSHWPLCNGQVVPPAPTTATLIELTHRITSGFALLLAVALLVLAWRERPAGHPARRWAVATLVLMLVEAGIGAGLVLLRLVGQNDSAARAAYMAVHLANTFFLLGAIAMTAWWAAAPGATRPPVDRRRAVHLGAALVGLLLVGATGAITALGDTLFPAASLAAGVAQDLSPTAHFLVRLRALHPLLAVAVGAYLIFLPQQLGQGRLARLPRKLGTTLSLLVLAQLAVGAINVGMLAPVPLQLFHLLLADACWVVLVLFGAAVISTPLAAPLPKRPLRRVDAEASPG